MEEKITLERMAYGADAVGHLPDGKVVFVQGALPQDTGVVTITENKATMAKADLTELITPSPYRVASPCVFGAYSCEDSSRLRCGGCPWQDLASNAQAVAKRSTVVESLARIGSVDAQRAETLVGDIATSSRQWGFRNKVELAATHAPQTGFKLGFYAANSHDIVNVTECKAAVKPLQKAPKALSGALRYLQNSNDLGIFRVGVRASLKTSSVEIALWTTPGAFPRAAVAKTLTSALPATSIVRVMAHPGKERKIKGTEVLAGDGFWKEKLGKAIFAVSAPSFFQVNSEQAEVMTHLVLEALTCSLESNALFAPGEEGRKSAFDPGAYGALSGKMIADLYSGCGTFSIPLAQTGAQVVAVESAASSVRDLRRNASLNHVSVEVIGGDTARELPALGELDALVVDPPRAGLADGVVESIAAAHPARVVYVSCNPTTWARDVARFEKNGFQLHGAVPVDLFPQTYHVEVVSVFTHE